MNKVILALDRAAGLVVDFVLVDETTGRYVDASALTSGAYAGADWADYVFEGAELGTGSSSYGFDFPPVRAGSYLVLAYERAGGTPAGPAVDTLLGQRSYGWDGFGFVDSLEVAAAAGLSPSMEAADYDPADASGDLLILRLASPSQVAPIAQAERASDLATIHTTVPHFFAMGQRVTVRLDTFNGLNVTDGEILSIPSSTTFTYYSFGSGLALSADTGTCTNAEVLGRVPENEREERQVAVAILADPDHPLANTAAGKVAATLDSGDVTGDLPADVGDVVLAASQPHYAPAVAGDAMTVAGTVAANVVQWAGAGVTGMPLPTSSYVAPSNASIASILTLAGAATPALIRQEVDTSSTRLATIVARLDRYDRMLVAGTVAAGTPTETAFNVDLPAYSGSAADLVGRFCMLDDDGRGPAKLPIAAVDVVLGTTFALTFDDPGFAAPPAVGSAVDLL